MRSKSKLHHEIKQKSKSKSQRIAIAFRNKKVVVRHEVSGAIAIPQASWGCAPALPNRMQMVFLRQAAGNQKFFDPTIFQKCWRGVGEQPTFAKQIGFATSFSDAIAFFETYQFAIDYLYKTSYKFGQGNGAIAARWQAKAGVEPPFSGRERPVFLREVTPRKTTCVRFGRIASLSAYVLFADEYVVRIADESFLDCSLQEVLLFLKWRTAFSHVPLRFQYHLIKTSVKEGSLPSLTIHLAELSQLDRSCLRLGFCNRSQSVPIFRQFTQLKLSIYQIKCLFFCLLHNLCKCRL